MGNDVYLKGNNMDINQIPEEGKQPSWYIIHTYSGYESKVEESLKNMVENNGLQDWIFDVKVPTEEDIVEKDGKRKVVLRKKFPSYVFIKMIYSNHIWYLVTQTNGVTGFVGPAGRPTPLTEAEVKRNGLEVVDISDVDLVEGNEVKIVNGALEGFTGIVESISAERQKVKVIVSMFGRQTPVELDFAQVEKF